MLCIIAFIVFLILFPILGFFPGYRTLFLRSWGCVFKRVTFKPCDINLGEELKNALLGKIAFKYPRFTHFLDRTFAFWALLFVIINVWSLVYVVGAGVNLIVYDTCDPSSGEGCSLSGDACGVAQYSLDFNTAINEGRILEWTAQPFAKFANTVTQIPNRFKNWNPEEYQTKQPTYYGGERTQKPLALEIIDPSCSSCKKLFQNIKESGFAQNYDITYLAYPIPNTSGGYRFPHSYRISTVLEAVKTVEPENKNDSQTPSDWQILETIFTEKGTVTDTLQNDFNFVYSKGQADAKLQEILKEIGYSKEQIKDIFTRAESSEITQIIAENKRIVEEKIQTIKIPTILFDGRRFDRVLEVDQLRK